MFISYICYAIAHHLVLKTYGRSHSPISSYGGLVPVPVWLPRPANYGQDFVTGGGSAPMGPY